MFSQYLERLKQFVSVELVNWQQQNKSDGNHTATATASSDTPPEGIAVDSVELVGSVNDAEDEENDADDVAQRQPSSTEEPLVNTLKEKVNDLTTATLSSPSVASAVTNSTSNADKLL